MVSSGLPMLKECCCGCSLKTGSMIIGYITMVWASILAFIAATSLVNGNHVIIMHDTNLDTVLQIAVLLVRILQAVFSLLLIIATHREQASIIPPWLLISLVAVVVEGASLALMISHLAVGDFNPRLFNLSTHVSVTVYFMFVVFSYYREARKKLLSSSSA